MLFSSAGDMWTPSLFKGAVYAFHLVLSYLLCWQCTFIQSMSLPDHPTSLRVSISSLASTPASSRCYRNFPLGKSRGDHIHRALLAVGCIDEHGDRPPPSLVQAHGSHRIGLRMPCSCHTSIPRFPARVNRRRTKYQLGDPRPRS